MKRTPAVIVHGLEMACTVLQVAQSCASGVTLLSATGAAGYAGVGWWRALIAVAKTSVPLSTPAEDVLDCGWAPDRALEALREGQLILVLRAHDPRIWADLSRRGAECNAKLLPEAPPALDLAERGAARKLEAWLRAAQDDTDVST